MRLIANIQTARGSILIQLHAEQTPKTVANFANLAQRGYYNGLNFHRVIANFMVQGGCPQGVGSGGPGYKFGDEIVATLKHNKAGILSMANAGPGTNGSQFFITHEPTPWLDGKHTVFGEVLSGQDIVNAIRQGERINEISIDGDVAGFLAQPNVAPQVAEWNKVLAR